MREDWVKGLLWWLLSGLELNWETGVKEEREGDEDDENVITEGGFENVIYLFNKVVDKVAWYKGGRRRGTGGSRRLEKMDTSFLGLDNEDCIEVW